ncbi:hypothetical protein BJ170DRAFT_472418 [Xylariales sp. AK1849]|nr:hypothetical protein BJ170DRAFT_472418 [Xylariales sp. AK1849]
MKPPTRIALRLVAKRPIAISTPALLPRQIHSSSAASATVSPIHGTGPPPEPPTPAADSTAERLERRKKHAALLRAAQAIRATHNSPSKAEVKAQSLPKRFWKDVHAKEVDGAWEIHLDKRPLRHPTTKQVIRIPPSKPLLAGALAIEWDMLVSAQQATKQHLIPLTSLVCRALDIAENDKISQSKAPESVRESIRAGIVRLVMRYLDTDSILCWAPPPKEYDIVEGVESLRDKMKRSSDEIVGFLSSRVWPGIKIEPVLDTESIVPKGQDEATRQIIEGWVMGLNPWELAGLERGVLAGKGLLGAVRLLVEWSEGFVGTGVGDGADRGAKKFGIEEAAKAANIEVDWQTSKWGEVEDTHDVEKEDLRRQLGSLVLLVSGTGKK